MRSLPARPKPYSIERRFRLMQAGSAALALLLISTVLYWNQFSECQLDLSLQQLQATLELETQLHSGHESTAKAFWSDYFVKEGDPKPAYIASSREFKKLLDRFDAFPFPESDWADAGKLHRLETTFLYLTGNLMAGARQEREDTPQLDEVNRLSGEIEASLRHLEDAQIRHLETLSAERNLFSRGMTILLIVFAGVAFLITLWFRQAHRNHLWKQLEHLRCMVAEVRRGNLDVAGEIPDSVELGSLMSGFLQMASELRGMRDSLEAKVVERTAKLDQAQNELIQSAKLASLGELVSGVAHEINNPLTSILGFSEIVLSRTEANAAIQAPVRTIRDEALRLRHLVANLTAFARRAPQRSHRLDLRQVLTRFAELRDYQLRANNVALHVHCPAEPVWVIADAEQLLQVVMNLVLNSEQAIKDFRERGDIWLACGIEGGNAWFSVKDDGSGMEPDVLDHIFDPFFTTKSPGKGTGLGLSISHGIIRQHHGTITAESKPGKGTTIRAKIPLAPIPPVETPNEPTAQRPDSHLERHVLAIDDEPDILEMVTEALEPMGCRTTTLHGSQGLEAALAQGDIDLVLCDLKMPGKNGFEIYRLLREKHPALADRFILMTGNLADAERYGAELEEIQLLPKPFTLARLREAVEEVLGKRTPA